MQSGGADQDAGQQLTKDRGQLQTHQHFRENAGCHEDQHKSSHPDQGFRHLQVVCRDLSQQGRDQRRHRSSEHQKC